MASFKFCILAAGRGTRSTKHENLHKSLLPVANKPAISWVIDEVDSSIPIVIALGYLGEQIVSYLEFVYPDRDFEFVWVDNFDKQGSGPGYSLMQCRASLSCPFVVTAVDTIINEQLACPTQNWIGVKRVQDCKPYCLYSDDEGFHYDEAATDALAFIGMGGVVDYEQFWENLANKKTIKNEHQMTNGFENLPALSFKEFTWHDVGNDTAYGQTQDNFAEPIVAEKEGEVLYIDNGKVVKFFSDTEKVKNRITRMRDHVAAPKSTMFHPNMYGYDYIDGVTLPHIPIDRIELFFEFCDSFFVPNGVNDAEFKTNCHAMYRDKTYDRIAALIGSDLDSIDIVEGVLIKSILSLLNVIDWNEIVSKAIPYRFHGDFQAENIVISDKIHLIDWRDSFGSSTTHGDMYYDLGKLHHSILIIGLSPNWPLTPTYGGFLLENFKLFCERKCFDWKHIELLGALQYITIASLYKDDRWKRFYFLLGKLRLTQLLE